MSIQMLSPARLVAELFQPKMMLFECIRFENLDYTKTKLFFLSILWRCHISSLAVFSQVKLGPHAERIRKMIFENNAGIDTEYEVILISLDTEGARPSKSVVDPVKLQATGIPAMFFTLTKSCTILMLLNIIRWIYLLKEQLGKTISWI